MEPQFFLIISNIWSFIESANFCKVSRGISYQVSRITCLRPQVSSNCLLLAYWPIGLKYHILAQKLCAKIWYFIRLLVCYTRTQDETLQLPHGLAYVSSNARRLFGTLWSYYRRLKFDFSAWQCPRQLPTHH